MQFANTLPNVLHFLCLALPYAKQFCRIFCTDIHLVLPVIPSKRQESVLVCTANISSAPAHIEPRSGISKIRRIYIDANKKSPGVIREILLLAISP